MDLYLLVLLPLTALALTYIFYVVTKNKRSSINHLVDDGFEHIFSGGGNKFIAFNLRNGRFRFGELLKYSYIERSISYIYDYEWKWVENNAQKVSSKFLFYISDVHHYMHEIFYQDNERKAEMEWAKIQAVFRECVAAQYVETQNMERMESYDFFISHASEDKDEFVRPLVKSLSNLGLKTWYDEFSLEIGDSLRRTIDHGLANSKYGIVVLSNAFFSKQWPQYELDALVNRSMTGEKVILPIWYGVQHKDVSQFSHSLADKVAFSTSSLNIEEMAQEFLKIIQKYN